MNETLKVLENRRSCRSFKPEMIKEEELNAIIKAGTYAATGMGKQSPIIIAVTDNTVKHGFPLQTKEVPMIDLRVVISDGKLIIRMQDNCPKYDLGTRIAELNKADLEEKQANLGTWLSQSLADDIRYVYSFETNTVFLEFNSAISEY